MNSYAFPGVEGTSHRASNRNNYGYGGDVTTTNVMDQFRFMHVSGDPSDTNEKQLADLARSFMTTLGITANDNKYSDQLAALTNQMSGMMKPSGSTANHQQQQQQQQVHPKPQTHSAAADGGLPSVSALQTSRSPKPTMVPPKSPNVNDSRRGRSPRREPIGARLKNVVDGMRSLSPFRSTHERSRSRSPLPSNSDNSDDNMHTDTDVEADADEFFETHSSMDSFMVTSPRPKMIPKQSAQGNSTPQKRPSTPSSPSTIGRPPLASVNRNSPLKSPPQQQQQQQSNFKFDKEHDKFNVGSSPPKNAKLGSPGKKVRSPSDRSKKSRLVSSPMVNTNQEPEISPLQVSPLSVSGPSPSPFKPSRKPHTSISIPPSQATGGAPPLFASPVPELFHAPDTFIRSSATRAIPTPHNIRLDDPQSDAATRRQTAPPNMATAAATAAGSFDTSTSRNLQTPFDQGQGPMNISSIAPDTAETCIKKKVRNTATPNLDVTSPIFSVDLSSNTNKPKGNGVRGNTVRKGFNSGHASSKTTGFSHFVFGLDEVKENGIDSTAPTRIESPSNESAVSMDTSPFLSPPPQGGARIPQGLNAAAQFSMGVGGDQSQPGVNLKSRTKRKDNKVRRAQGQRGQRTQISGSSQSTFDLNIARNQQQEKLSKTRLEIITLRLAGKGYYMNAKYKEAIQMYCEAIQKYKIELFAHVPSKDLLAVLLSNRAEALMEIGAYESAIEDSRNGIHFVTDPRNKNPDLFSPDANPTLRPMFYNRMAESYLKLGKVDDADRAFSEAVESANVIQDFHKRENIVGMYDELDQTKTEAILGRTDVVQVRKFLTKIKRLDEQKNIVQPRVARDQAMESLGLVKEALRIANGCTHLHHIKVELLAGLKRWREIMSHCERFAASNVKYDGCLVGDLSSKNPLPGVPVAKKLRFDFFGDTKEYELKGAEMKLSRQAAGEAILRLPYSMMPYYLRSLRLNERYLHEDDCFANLDRYVAERKTASTTGDSIQRHFLWLAEERNKLRRTKAERNMADAMFSNAEYEKAALRYAECLTIDSGGSQNCSGGRLHAILHCNRAACYMAVKRYSDAMSECTAALRIYPRYLKALLRRARCYNRLERNREAENDYNHWLEIVKRSREKKSIPIIGDCIFDGPHAVKDKEAEDVQGELNDLIQAQARAEADERARKARNDYKERNRKYHSERFHYNSSSDTNRKESPAHEDAHRRRENFYGSQNSSRRFGSQHSKQEKSSSQNKKNNKDDYGFYKKKDDFGYKKKDDFGYKKKDDYGYKTKSKSSKAAAPAASPRENNNHYSALGISRKATVEEIKKAYKKMALKYHPDKNTDNPTAADNFLRIKDAYEILKDANARRKYDCQTRRF